MKGLAFIATVLLACSAFADTVGRYAPVNGLSMYYEIHGVADAKNPPLVLLHGGGSTIETSFGNYLPALAKSRQVIACSIAMQIAIRHPKLVRKLVVASAMYKRDGLPPEFWEGMRKATLASMPAELRDAYVRVAPHPERLQSFHDKSVKRMLEFKDWPADMLRSIEAPTLS